MRLKRCRDYRGVCFARTPKGGCRILSDCPAKCHFKKYDRHYTKGRYYPDNSPSGTPLEEGADE